MSLTKVKYCKIVNNDSIKTYLGYLRKEYNSYHFDTVGAPLNSRNFATMCTNYLDRRSKELVRFNTEVANPYKAAKGLPVLETISKKSRTWTLVKKEGITLKFQNNTAFLDCKGVIYKFTLDTKLTFKDGIYTDCSISMSEGQPILAVNLKKYRSFRLYISNPHMSYLKKNHHQKAHAKYCKELWKIKDSKISDSEKSLKTQKIGKDYIMDLINFTKTLSEKYCNTENKTSINNKFEIYKEAVQNLKDYKNQGTSQCESQALNTADSIISAYSDKVQISYAELKQQIVQEYVPVAENEYCIKTLLKVLY